MKTPSLFRPSLTMLAACLGLLLAVAGCATSAGGDTPFNRMVTADTGFYQEGPDQNLPPSRTLYAGTRLRIEGMSGEFYKVRLVSGEEGWVRAMDVGAVQERQTWTGSGR